MEFGPLNPLVKIKMPKIAHKLRVWDKVASDRVDLWIANSENTASRIKKYYKKEAHVIYPPVNTNHYRPTNKIKDFYLACSRLIPYKKIDLVIKAFNELKLPLKIVGTGPMEKTLRKMAAPNIEFLGRVSDNELKRCYAESRAFIFPAEEDFGIVPIEAMASGRPVIAYGKGGAKETVIPEKTGLLFESQNKEDLCKAIKKFQRINFDSSAIRKFAEQFDIQIFQDKIKKFVYASYEDFLNERYSTSKT